DGALARANAIAERQRPSVVTRDHAYPVRAQKVQFAGTVAAADPFHIGVTGQKEMTVERFEQAGPVGAAMRI
ncbi:hypothetical protein, partial [Klebsiella michiganensis]|uniref:hypothetical protein n=1 Tax=Klebsiella michiganensis TaxID=1134687 RepID=UPI0013D4A3CF